MRDLALVGFLLALIVLGFRRPFLFVLAYAYVDIVSPQRLAYYLLNAVPVSLICVLLAVGGWVVADDKRGARFGVRQSIMLILLLYCFWTTLTADFPVEALTKWGWVWKAMAFAIFLPLTLRTRLRIESMALFLVLSASSIIVVGGIKTIISGGGYGVLNLMIADNSGLYESSTISAVSVAIIPIVLWLARHGTIYPRGRLVSLYATGLVFACLLVPVGTQARTGIICIGVLAVLMLRSVRRRMLYIAGIAVAVAIAVPLLPASYTQRMDTIQGYKADSSASTRIAVWKWTLDYVGHHPFGGGFEAYRQNRLVIDEVKTTDSAGGETVSTTQAFDAGRAYHSSYFEMLGEQGWPGLILWLMLHALGIVRMEVVRRRWARDTGDHDAWIAPLATALQHAHLIYLVGALFVGIAFQPFIYMLVGLEIGFDAFLRRTRAPAKIGFTRPSTNPKVQPPKPVLPLSASS
ncbi:putative O-glycosylation ligase, exosortase A system-associated [Sphingomonas montana]|uniref:putative O-glycosylation ligase, exosortase A system-associated n=1 Tax=Sphingomonas montana TaxID=1843236 RepID=UPI00096EE768|nr:putative O-glycosylation ligase, exosortase A system-associated [Sphingomonas montana]